MSESDFVYIDKLCVGLLNVKNSSNIGDNHFIDMEYNTSTLNTTEHIVDINHNCKFISQIFISPNTFGTGMYTITIYDGSAIIVTSKTYDASITEVSRILNRPIKVLTGDTITIEVTSASTTNANVLARLELT